MAYTKHNIIPLKGTDILQFGTSRKDIRNKFPELYNGSFKRGADELDDYGIFHAYFENDILFAVEFFEQCEIYFGEKQLMGMELDACTQLFLALDADLSIEADVGFSSAKLQIGVYAPCGTIESVMVAKKGYYS